MTIPNAATFESFLGTGHDGRPVALWDVSSLLPRHRTKRYKTRPLEAVRRLYLHHSGKLGAPGYAGLRGTARYATRQRGWPSAAYHFWIPYKDDLDPEGRRVVYRAQPTEAMSYHTKGSNDRGIGIALQGNLTARPMSDQQVYTLPLLLDWLALELGISPEPIGHFQAPIPKPSCPGNSGKGWLFGYAAGRESMRG